MNSMKHFLRVVICVAVAAIAVGLIWMFAKPYARKAQWQSSEAEKTSSSGPLTFLPQREDGSGQAGIALRLAEMTVRFDTPGWQCNDQGWWYACDADTCYANGWVEIDGESYHFDSDGYMSSGGWLPIGGKGCYFDEQGVYHREKTGANMVALTFDDGPREHTSRLLDVLEENSATASFMLMGANAETYGELCIPRMVELGCTIGNHSYNHPDMTQLKPEEAEEQLQMTDEIIAKYTGGEAPAVVRFPYGSYTKELAESTGRPCMYWDVDVYDWGFETTDEADALCNAVMKEVVGGCIVLLHDTHAPTVDACEKLIPRLIEEGYELVSLETLAAARGFSLEPGVTYFGFTDREIANGSATDK